MPESEVADAVGTFLPEVAPGAKADAAGALVEVALLSFSAPNGVGAGALVLGFSLGRKRFCVFVWGEAVEGLVGLGFSRGFKVRHFDEYSANISASFPWFLLNSFSATSALAGLKIFR